MRILRKEEMQDMDYRTINDLKIPSSVLMENAGKSATEVLMRNRSDLAEKKIAIIAGKGNNGGDAFVIARWLFQKNISSDIFILTDSDDLKNDAKTNFEILKKLDFQIFEIKNNNDLKKYKKKLQGYDVFVDGIFGVGLKREIEGFIADLIRLINSFDKFVFAVDIASGVDANSGEILNEAIKADLTCTFAFAKLGHFLYPGAEYTKKLEIVDIGIPKLIEKKILSKHFLLEEQNIKNYLRSKKRKEDAHKNKHGHLFAIAGSKGKTGAAILLCRAAESVGCGLITLASDKETNFVFESSLIETMTACFDSSPIKELFKFSLDKSSVAIGPGLGVADRTFDIVKTFVENSSTPLVLDADAINVLARDINILKKKKTDIVLTPHPKEMARLINKDLSYVLENKIEIARSFATKFKVSLILKGANTICAFTDGNIYINPFSNHKMARAGSGDILTGFIAGFLSQGYEADKAARIAVYAHAKTGEILAKKRFAFSPSQIIRKSPFVLEELYKGQS